VWSIRMHWNQSQEIQTLVYIHNKYSSDKKENSGIQKGKKMKQNDIRTSNMTQLFSFSLSPSLHLIEQ
jgi:hypothetical protein